ncbi:hypothetical protein EJB05_37416, partial [Eragrostis curvula]
MTTPERPGKRCRRNSKSPAAVTNIPDDVLISHVFWRLPVDSLVSVKFVCRSWRAAIEDPGFVRRHLKLSCARRPPSFLVVPRAEDANNASVSEDVSFHRLLLDEKRAPETADVELVFETAVAMANAVVPTHCDGLVALATATEQVFVCNPATREFVALPPGSRDVRPIKDRAPAAALGYDASRDRYVVARYFYREYRPFKDADGKGWLDFEIGHEVFTLGGDVSEGSWELTDDPPHAIGPARPICTRDAIYWCTEHLKPNALLRFSLRDRAFDVVPCPPGENFRHGVDHVTELSGKLCYVRTDTVRDTAFDVWVADDDGPRPEWHLRCRVDFDDYGPDIGSEILLPVAAAGHEMLIAADHSKLYSYDARYRSVRKVVDMEKELKYARADGTEFPDSDDEDEQDLAGLVHHVVPYVESLVPISNRTKQKPGGGTLVL